MKSYIPWKGAERCILWKYGTRIYLQKDTLYFRLLFLFQVSPADGTVLHYGKVENGYLEQVKGVKYSLSQFLGPQSWSNSSEDSSKSLADYQKSLLKNPNNELYHCVIYLAPGDYHRFHSPTNWRVKFRRHFPGM